MTNSNDWNIRTSSSHDQNKRSSDDLRMLLKRSKFNRSSFFLDKFKEKPTFDYVLNFQKNLYQILKIYVSEYDFRYIMVNEVKYTLKFKIYINSGLSTYMTLICLI